MNFILAAFLLAQPGFFERLWHRLYEKEDAEVAQGNALAAQNDPEGALREYDKAKERLAENPALHLNRSGALLKMEPDKAPEALSEAAQALQHGDNSIKSQAAYDMGVASEAMGKPDEAMKDYMRALSLDPEDRDAKVNLELLLKTEEERKQKQQQAQQQDDKQKQEGSEEKKKKKNEGKEQDSDKPQQAPQQQQKEKEAEQPQQAPQQQEQAKLEEKKKEQMAEEKPVDRSEAERLLDALRAGEKNLQVWRFAKDKRKEARRNEPEKDW